MEIHKPHAVKTWREFAVELGTITAGILVALTLEQFIEWQHDLHRARWLARTFAWRLPTT